MTALVGAPFLLKFLGLRKLDPAELFYLGVSIAVIGGIAGGLLAGVLARYLVQLLPKLFLRIAVVFAGWCSYFVVIYALNFAIDRDFSENIAIVFSVAALEAVAALIAAWFVARDSERFRTGRIRLPYGMPFRKRGPSPPAPSVR
jgi:ABC-type lipoprotein release transport system permease subunit